jgi:hypothetical protein
LRVLSAKLMGLAREGDVVGFRAYVRSDAFLAAFNGLDPSRRQSVMRCYGEAEALCESKASRPLVKPGPFHTKRACEAYWGSPQMRAKVADAYVQAAETTSALRGS